MQPCYLPHHTYICAEKIQYMTTGEIVSIIVSLLLAGMMAWIAIEFRAMKNEFRSRAGINNETIKLRLQAYERLTLFAERCGLQNMVARISPAGMSVAQLHSTLLETLHTEYEYNISQQVYVSSEIWRAVTNLKEQNIYIVNQLTSTLQPGAAGIDLSKAILELLSINTKADLHAIVLDALRFEARKII